MKPKVKTLRAEDFVGHLADMWKAMPYDVAFEIEFALQRGQKIEAIKRLMCAVQGLDLAAAKSLVEQRQVELAKTV